MSKDQKKYECECSNCRHEYSCDTLEKENCCPCPKCNECNVPKDSK